MKQRPWLLPLLLLSSATLASGDDELQRLKAENAKLKAQIENLQRQQSASACTVGAAAPAAANSSPAAQAPAVAAPAVATAPAAAPTPMTAPASTPPTLPTPPPGYVIVKAPPASATPALPTPPPGYVIVKAPEPYSTTGCRDSMFDFHSVDAPWKHEENWESLGKGMSPKDVEHWLGVEHYDVKRNGDTLWQFGKCGSNVQGTVVFEGGEVLFWQAPDF